MMTKPLDEAYVGSLAQGVLAVQHCGDCGYNQHPPALRCERCGGSSLALTRTVGIGRVVSYTVLHRGPTEWHSANTPYRYAIVQLDDGPRLVTQLRPSGEHWPGVGEAVRACFVPLGPEPSPAVVFEPLTDMNEDGGR